MNQEGQELYKVRGTWSSKLIKMIPGMVMKDSKPVLYEDGTVGWCAALVQEVLSSIPGSRILVSTSFLSV